MKILIICLTILINGAVVEAASDHYSMLQSTIPAVRRQGVAGIASTRDPSEVARLGNILRNDPHFTVRAEAAEALGNIRNRDAVPYLISALSDSNRNVKVSAVVSLGYLRDREAVEPLISLAGSEEDPGIVISVLNVLGVIGDPAARTLLEESLRSDNSRIRQISAQSLGRLRLSDSVNVLVNASDDPDRGVRMQAVRALGEIGDERAVRPLRRRLRSEDDREVQVAVAHSLGQLGQDDGLDIALEASRSEDQSIRRSGLRALASVGKLTPAVESAVMEAAMSDNPAVRRDAELAASFLNIQLPSAE